MIDIGIKERQKYRDISWLMPSVDVDAVLARLGIEVHARSGQKIFSLCPDHALFTGHESSHPKWILYVDTGDTYCLTEGRGSNLLWTVCRMMECHPREALKLMTGMENGGVTDDKIALLSVRGRINKMMRKREVKPIKEVADLDNIHCDLEKRPISERCYQFFIHPPDKLLETNISRETVDRFKVFERTWGYYSDRAIIPFFLHGVLKGFAAVDILGEKKWHEKHPLSDNYRKTLTALNFNAGSYLFGYDDCQYGMDYSFIVEGPREVMKLRQEGYPALAPLGTNVGPEQIKMLCDLAPKRLVLMFDGDPAGIKATEEQAVKLRLFKTQKIFLPHGVNPKNLNSSQIKNLLEGRAMA